MTSNLKSERLSTAVQVMKTCHIHPNKKKKSKNLNMALFLHAMLKEGTFLSCHSFDSLLFVIGQGCGDLRLYFCKLWTFKHMFNPRSKKFSLTRRE